MISLEFLTTALVVVLVPGTGVIFTVSNGILDGKRASIAAAFGCTLGIIPHLVACSLGLSLLIHTSALAFQALKLIGGVYLLYLAWTMWRENSSLNFHARNEPLDLFGILRKGFLINILNPKLSLFFLAFLPSFITPGSTHPTYEIGLLSFIFMIMTLFVFILYGLCASRARIWLTRAENFSVWLHRSFATCFAVLGVKLVFTDK